MKSAPIPGDEPARINALQSYDILDTPPESAFDVITALAAHVADVPIALVSLVDTDRQWFKSRYGLDAPESRRDISLCGHAVAAKAPLIVPDTLLDERFVDNPLVTDGPRIRFYAGMPLSTAEGYALGTLCVIDQRPRELDPQQLKLLEQLSRQVMDQLELRRRQRRLKVFHNFFELSLGLLCTIDDKLFFREINPAWEEKLGWTLDELRVGSVAHFVHPDDLDDVLAEAERVLDGAGGTARFEARYRHKNGDWIPLAWSVAAHDGVLYATAMDVAQYKRYQTT